LQIEYAGFIAEDYLQQQPRQCHGSEAGQQPFELALRQIAALRLPAL
jgi:hypothetical protein